MRLLPEAELIKTSSLDQGAWSYHGLLGWVIRRRMHLALRLLSGRPGGRLLEVGYGSGLFLPTLAGFATQLHGIDVHDHAVDVAAVLARHGVPADLRTGSVTALPYADASMDTVVCLSVLEFVPDLDDACEQLSRVLAPGGRLVVVTPGFSRVVDLGLRLLTGERAEDTFQGRRQKIRPALVRHFALDRTLRFPGGSPPVARLYTAMRLGLA